MALLAHPTLDILYVVTEGSVATNAQVHALAIDGQGVLSALDMETTSFLLPPAAPLTRSIALDAARRFLYLVNTTGSSVAVFNVATDGTLSAGNPATVTGVTEPTTIATTRWLASSAGSARARGRGPPAGRSGPR